MRLFGVVAALGATAAVIAGGSAGMAPAACTGSQLSGAFVFVPGSPGAGHVAYWVQLKNTSSEACFVSGLVSLKLYGKTGKALPTHVSALNPGALTAVKVTVAPGHYASATARFSPDVPGQGEPQNKQCEPTAYKVKIGVPPGGGSVMGAIKPPTPVCEKGGMVLTALVAGKHGPAL